MFKKQKEKELKAVLDGRNFYKDDFKVNYGYFLSRSTCSTTSPL